MIILLCKNNRYRKVGKSPLLLSPVRKIARNQISEKINSKIIEIEETGCPQFQSCNKKCISGVDYFGIPISVSVCLDCSLVYTSRKISNASMNEIYSSTLYGQIDRGSPEPPSSYFERGVFKGANIFAHISVFQKPLVNQTVLDVGCGTGGVLSYFKKQGCLETGLDLGYENIQYGRTQHDLNLICGDIDHLDDILEVSIRFDFIILEQTLEHLSNPIGMLKVLRKRLNPNGLLYIGVPGFRNIREQYDGDLLRYIQFPHLVHFTLSSLSSILNCAGFNIIWGNESISAIAQISPTSTRQIKNESQSILDYVTELKSEFWSIRRIAKRLFFTYPIWFLGYIKARYTGNSQ